MENRTTTNTFLKYFNPNTGEERLVSIESILDGGVPLISEGYNEGDDMQLLTDDLFDVDWNQV